MDIIGFLPYLWGMETSWISSISRANSCFYLTYEEWKQYNCLGLTPISYVFTLPMRNGNTGGETPSVSGIIVFTLPMRNGNLIKMNVCDLRIFGFYLTYEEWKRRIYTKKRSCKVGFYLTYEEWKLVYVIVNAPLEFSFYLTYEEWKHTNDCGVPAKYPCFYLIPIQI